MASSSLRCSRFERKMKLLTEHGALKEIKFNRHHQVRDSTKKKREKTLIFQFEASSNGNANNKVVFNSKDNLSSAQISELLRFVKNVKFLGLG